MKSGCKLLCIPLLILFTTEAFPQTDSAFRAYLLNNEWHTGILLKNDSITRSRIPALSLFFDYKHVDIGWGDAEFYMTPEFKLDLAIKAAVASSGSVVRIEGFNAELRELAEWNDFVIEFRLDSAMYGKLCSFINKSFSKNENKEVITVKSEHKGKIKFFKSGLSYSAFNTCNTWVAKALNAAGFDVSTFMVLTEDNLLNAVEDTGKILKK